jgi:hypothetical protein
MELFNPFPESLENLKNTLIDIRVEEPDFQKEVLWIAKHYVLDMMGYAGSTIGIGILETKS